MTTSVIYAAEIRGMNMAAGVVGLSGELACGVATNTIYSNLTNLLTTGVTQVQSTNASASTTNPAATFTSTPTNGNALIAILWRGADNVASTNSSWTLLTSAGAAGTRRLEIWWRRAGASEPTTHTWTNATAALWDLTLLECGGWASVANPIVTQAAANGASGTSASFGSVGILAAINAVNLTNTAGTFSNTATNAESDTLLPITTSSRFRASVVDGWTNQAVQTLSYNWTTARTFTYAQVGWPNGAGSNLTTVAFAVGNQANTAGSSTVVCGQAGIRFDTSSIPAGNTVTSATLSMASGISSAWPSTASIDAYSLSGASITASNTNGPLVWKTPTEFASLTSVATRAAGSTTAAATTYNWTSRAGFPAAINKGASTTLLIASSDQETGTTRTTDQYAWINNSASNHYLTIVHKYQASVSVPPSGTYSLTLVPAVTRSYEAKRTTSASLTANPTIARTLATARAVATSLNVTPTITRLAGFVRTIASTLTGAPSIIANIGVARSASATLTTVPTVTRVASFARSVTNTVGLIGGVAATVVPIIAALTHRVSLRVRHTVTLAVPDRIRLTVRSKLRLPEE